MTITMPIDVPPLYHAAGAYPSSTTRQVPIPWLSYSQWADSYNILVIAYKQFPYWAALALIVAARSHLLH